MQRFFLFFCLLSSTAFAQDTCILVNANSSFAFDLYARLKESPGNLFFSPYSISDCLAMVYSGARGQTRSQMAQVLHFESAAPDEAFHLLQKSMGNDGSRPFQKNPAELDIANALWVQKGAPLRKAFLDNAVQNYGALVKQADFADAKAACAEINQWVSGKTKGKIKDILGQNDLTDSTVMLAAVNAIYFKGTWDVKFDKSGTKTEPFNLAEGGQKDCELMGLRNKYFLYAEGEDYQAAKFPYRGGLSMIILLPKKANGLPALEKKLSSGFLSEVTSAMSDKKLEVYLPKFKTDSAYQLKNTLAQMGMPMAFNSGSADFSGIMAHPQISITHIIHKACLGVDEDGTEAAAATVVTAGFLSGRGHRDTQPPIIFRADHPFFFLIRDDNTGSLLFMGRFVSPD